MNGLPRLAGGGRLRLIACVAALSAAQAAVAGAAAFAMRDVFAALALGGDDIPALPIAVIALAGVALAGLRVAERVSAERLGHDYAAALRLCLFDRVSRLPASALAGRRRGGLALRFVGDLSAARNWVSLGIARLVSAAIVLPAALMVLALLDRTLALGVAAIFMLGLMAMALIAKGLRPRHRRLRDRRAALAARVSERLPHAPQLRMMGQLKHERRAIARQSARLAEAAVDQTLTAAVLRMLPDIVSAFAAAMILWQTLAAGAPAALAAAALAALAIAVQPMRDLATIADRQRAWSVARDKCEALLNGPALPGRRRAAQSRSASDAPLLAFQRVSHGPLRRVAASLRPGERIAVTGANGAGKSTLLSLAAGLERPTSGRVRLAGCDPARLPSAANPAFYAGQDPAILAGSLRRALTLGTRSRPDDETILAMAEQFGLGRMIRARGGLGARLAEGGRDLSAGERRRVGLIRAALSGAALLLLDEPDDALDRDAPALIRTLFSVTPAAVLFVTHNPAVAAEADVVWQIDAGRVTTQTDTTRSAEAAQAA
ncbi:MAG: ABC transporter ATP-binding protein [Pseudomonadota bacterium]